MKAQVTKQGVHIPQQMLGEAKEVEIRQENGCIVVVPLPEDPIYGLGAKPVTCNAPDASQTHDSYLY